MRTIPSILACALLVSLLPGRFAGGQDVHNYFGNRAANTTEDLQKAITKFPYTWEVPDGKSTVTFNSDGTGKQTFFTFTWQILDAQQIELTITGGTNKAKLRFSDDYTSYTGSDFTGSSGLHGTVVLPKAPAARPSLTPIAAATPAPAKTPSGNSFFDSLTTGQNTDTTEALQKAIVGSTYTWEPDGDMAKTVTFLAGGVGQTEFFKITWRARAAHELEIAIPNNKAFGKIVLRFNTDFTKYTATDFDGNNLTGHKVKQE